MSSSTGSSGTGGGPQYKSVEYQRLMKELDKGKATDETDDAGHNPFSEENRVGRSLQLAGVSSEQMRFVKYGTEPFGYQKDADYTGEILLTRVSY